MPLRKSTQSTLRRLSSESASDTGYETLDSVVDDQSQMHSSTSMSQHADGLMEGDVDEDDDDDESPDEWLESRGVAAEEIRRIKSKQVLNVTVLILINIWKMFLQFQVWNDTGSIAECFLLSVELP